MPIGRLLYCLTRDEQLAGRLEGSLDTGLAFFYNDAARLHLAVSLRRPDVVVLDIDAIRPEFGDAGLAPVIAQVRERAPDVQLAVRPAAGAERLVAAEAGEGVDMLPAEAEACVGALLTALHGSEARAAQPQPG